MFCSILCKTDCYVVLFLLLFVSYEWSILRRRETSTEEYPDHSRFKGYRSREGTFLRKKKNGRKKDWKLEMGRLSESDGIFILIDAAAPRIVGERAAGEENFQSRFQFRFSSRFPFSLYLSCSLQSIQEVCWIFKKANYRNVLLLRVPCCSFCQTSI